MRQFSSCLKDKFSFRYPKVQEKVREEIYEVIGKENIPSWAANHVDLPYTEATIMEIQRFGNIRNNKLTKKNIFKGRFQCPRELST